MKNCLKILSLFIFLCSCSVSHTLPVESALIPHRGETKWWIINSVSKDKNGKDIHLCALVNMEFVSGDKYGGCFFSAWFESDSAFYSGVKNTDSPDLQFKDQFPVSVTAYDTASGGWSWTMKRSSTTLEGMFNKRNSVTVPFSHFRASLSYETQKPFNLSHMLSSPDVWIAKPLNSIVSVNDLKSTSAGKLFISTITGRTVLFERARKDYVTWVDLSLNSGEQLNLLFRTDSKGSVSVDAALLWDKNGNSTLNSGIEVRTKRVQIKTAGTKPYPLYYSINLPGSNINISLHPRLQNQEVENNRSSFWMGAVEAVNPNTGAQQGKGNMYIFKQ